MNNISDNTCERKENLPLGLLGAFLFSLVGGIIWFVLYRLGYIAGISGIIGVICALKGYSIFAKKESYKGIVLSVLLAVLVLVVAQYCCVVSDTYDFFVLAYEDGYIEYPPTIADAFRGAPAILLAIEGALGAYLKDLGIGMLFCAMGTFGYLKVALSRVRSSKYGDVIAPISRSEEEKTSDEETI